MILEQWDVRRLLCAVHTVHMHRVANLLYVVRGRPWPEVVDFGLGGTYLVDSCSVLVVLRVSFNSAIARVSLTVTAHDSTHKLHLPRNQLQRATESEYFSSLRSFHLHLSVCSAGEWQEQ